MKNIFINSSVFPNAIIALFPLVIGIGCFIAFNVIGSEVNADGILVEPFFLIPLSYLFITIGVIASAVLLHNYLKKKKNT